MSRADARYAVVINNQYKPRHDNTFILFERQVEIFKGKFTSITIARKVIKEGKLGLVKMMIFQHLPPLNRPPNSDFKYFARMNEKKKKTHTVNKKKKKLSTGGSH
jgi:hypothetical protein